MFKSKIISILFFISIFCLIPTVVSAASIQEQTETVDLRELQTVDNLETYGWKWNSQTKTLTLKNANFEVTGDEPCFTFSEDDNITVIYDGINNLKSESKPVFDGAGNPSKDTNGSLTFRSPSNGTLNLAITKVDGRGEFNVGNTINYAYNLNIESGTINSRGGFLVDGTATISGGTLNIDSEDMASSIGKVNGIYALVQVKITGGNVNIKSNDSAIIATGTPGEWDTKDDGVVISGGNISLSTQSPNAPIVAAGTLKEKDIVINGGNITLDGGYGFYTQNGSIEVNSFDSLNTNNVENDVFKVAKDNGGTIIYADADYSKVDEAIARANKLNKEDYKDFSAVEQAINAVVRGKNIMEQSEVDAMADAINNAINSLELIEKTTEPDEPIISNEPTKTDANPIETNKIDDTPKTGTNKSTVITVIVLMVSLFGIITFKNKKIR